MDTVGHARLVQRFREVTSLSDQPSQDDHRPRGYVRRSVWRQHLGSMRPPLDQPQHVRVAEFLLGLVACVGLAALAIALVSRADVFSVFGPLVIIAVNVVAMAASAMMGHKSFLAGFAAGYGVILLIGVVVCFAFVEI